MNILVCFKIVKDYDDILPRDWQGIEGFSLDMSYSKWKINDFDEGGLELALLLKDRNKDIKITALTIGDNSYPPIFQNLLSVGVDEIYRLLPTRESEFNPADIAKIISDFIEKNRNYDLIILGNTSGSGDHGITPQILGEMIELPVISQVIKADFIDDGIKILSELDSGFKEVIFNRPIILAVGNVLHPALRFSTLREKMKSKNKKPIEIEVNYKNQRGFNIKKLYYQKEEKETKMIKNSNIDDFLEKLINEIGAGN